MQPEDTRTADARAWLAKARQDARRIEILLDGAGVSCGALLGLPLPHTNRHSLSRASTPFCAALPRQQSETPGVTHRAGGVPTASLTTVARRRCSVKARERTRPASRTVTQSAARRPA